MKSERLELHTNDVKLVDQILESMPDSSEKMLQLTQRLLNRERQHGRYIVRDQLARGGMGENLYRLRPGSAPHDSDEGSSATDPAPGAQSQLIHRGIPGHGAARASQHRTDS